jgi:Tol biopolymer transport system component
MTRAAKTLGAAATISIVVAIGALAQQALSPDFVLVDRSGSRTVLGPAPASAFAPRISPDGRQIAFSEFGGSLALVDVGNVRAVRTLPTLPGANFVAWDAAGERIFYVAQPTGRQALFFTSADGRGFPMEPVRDPARAPDSYSAAHTGVSFITLEGEDYDLWFYSEADRTTIPIAVIKGSRQLSSQISPDGRWIAYKSDETGAFEVWVQPFPSGPRTRVTTRGGNNPRWSPDGHELFFDDGRQLFAVAMTSASPLAFSAPQALPITGFVQSGSLRRQWDVMPDGRFLIMSR